MKDTDVYGGNHFNIGTVGREWVIWRICSDEGETEEIILSTEAMDELQDYFVNHYWEDRPLDPAKA